MICTKSPGSNLIELCYFNNTKCTALYQKVEPIKFVFDQSVFELKSPAFLKDDINKIAENGPEVPACVVDLRSSRDSDHPDERRFLMGNTFLKNFYSVYDYDWQQVRLGVNIHAAQIAKAYPFEKSAW